MYFAKGLLFDLDGTLVESSPDIANAANLMLEQLGLPRAREQDLTAWVGNGAPRLVKRALTGEMEGEPDPDLFEQALPLFFDLYADYVWVHSVVYPGVISTLALFRQCGFGLACVTNKPGRHTELLLQASGLAEYFTCTVAGDALPRQKPDPAPLVYAAKALGLAVSDCIMVGDSVNDIFAAQAAAMPVLCLTYGYNQGLDLSTYNPDAMVDQFADLTQLIDFDQATGAAK